MKKIVTGVDDSPTASLAARRAAELAEKTGAELHLVSATDNLSTTTYEAGPRSVVVTPGESAEAIANRVKAGLLDDFPGLTIIADAAPGKVGDALVDYARSVDADLIVVGNKRVQGISRVLGSVARDVATHAHCDVYVAHTVEK